MSDVTSFAEAKKKKDKARWITMHMEAFDRLEHECHRELLERRADVERAARDRL